jgi:hypothetical protein
MTLVSSNSSRNEEGTDTMRKSLRVRDRVVVVLTAAALGITGWAVTGVSAPDEAQAASSVGGKITRTEVLARAADWYSRRHDSDMTYSQVAKTWDGGHTRQYRRDCSGFVNMAWHMNADPNTDGLDSSTYTTPISRSELRPGDLLDDTINDDGGAYPYHAILFGGWENANKTRFWYYSFGSTPVDKVTGASFSDSTLSGHATWQYKALRYKNIVEDAVDFSGDGRADVLARSASTTDVYLFKGDGSGGFDGGGVNIGNNWSGYNAIFQAGDFSGDGKVDVLARNATDADLYLFKGDGSGGFSGSGVLVGNNWSGFNAIFSPGDFTGDGNPDVLARSASTTDLYLFRGNGSGGFSGGGTVVGNNWSDFNAIFSPGDFTGDGDTDVLARSASTTDLYLFRGNGSGGFSGSATVVGNNWAGLDLIFSPGDFTGDGNGDVLARNATDKDLYLFRGNGSGGFSGGATVVGNNWSDFNTIF